MNPLVLWLEHHSRDQWQSQEVRDAWNQTHPEATDAQWRSALSQAYARERVVYALDIAGPDTTVGQALYGVFSFGQMVTIPVLVYATDAAGHSTTFRVDVTVTRTMTVSSIEDQIREGSNLMTFGLGPEGLQVDDIQFLPGTYKP